ncbi:TniQ family protein [Streptomyces sp. NPDC058268]|uniref:TniQ family protein n=2 Tax=unclassified Streptomyces TaxID=2593676 RepID=UPI0036E4D8E8
MRPRETFPIRLNSVPGEALDSWLEALAHRLHTPLGDVLLALGAHPQDQDGPGSNSTQSLTRLLAPDAATAIARTTGTAPDVLHTMTLAHYGQRVLSIDQASGLVIKSSLWGRSSGSRFCPDCLADTGGRWQLSWRLGWSFACVKHGRLLADLCPHCGSDQRRRPHAISDIPQPGHCPNPIPEHHPEPRKRRCDADLSQTITPVLDRGHPALEAQRILDEMAQSGIADFGLYADDPQPAASALADLRALAGRLLAHAAKEALAEHLPKGLPLTRDETKTLLSPSGPDPLARRGMTAPKSAVITAVGVTIAMNIMTRLDIQQAGATMRWITTPPAPGRPAQNVRISAPWGRGTTTLFRSVQLAAAGPQLRAIEQIRYRVRAARPGALAHPRNQAHPRVRSIPAAFWPELALRIAPPDNHHYRIMRPALACLVGLVGIRQSVDAVARHLGNATTGSMASRMLNQLRDQPHWPHIQTALTNIAEYLDAQPAPIDYQRRRRIDYTHLLPDDEWADIARQLGIVSGSGGRARLFRNFLFGRISGLPATMGPPTCIPTNGSARSQQGMIYRRLTPELIKHLDHAAQEFLRGHHVINEPLTWQPPTSLICGLPLPGLDPSEIDTKVLHQMLREREMTATQAAEELGTSLDMVRYLLGQDPAPDTAERPLRIAPVSDPVRAALDPALFTQLYCEQKLSLRAIGERYGVNADVIRGIADDYEIPIRTPKEYRPLQPNARHCESLSRAWLLEHYVKRRQTLLEVAAEAGMSPSNVAKWARTHNIPLRPRGGASHNESLRIRDTARQAPRILRPALNGLAAEERIRRFATASTYPTLGAAAADMGINESSLSSQISRLARDLGGPLHERAEQSHPMKLTPLGKRVAKAATAWLATRDELAEEMPSA